jgi:pimeloyl-ACP methyl ester carboxylesterase
VEIHFPVGFHHLHDDVALNFQLNRFLPGARLEDLQRVAPRIRDLRDWSREMLGLAEEAEKEGRLEHAATYYRMAEFFLPPESSDNARAYARFRELFGELTRGEPIDRLEVPYESGALPVMRLAAPNPKDTVLVCGGFDSFLEEIYPTLRTLRDARFDVIGFEGPGQGAARKAHGLPMTHEWERPVGAVLDHLGVERCTLIGVSLGGYLAPRAAVYEPRIRRVVAWDVFDSFLDCLAHARGRLLVTAQRMLTGLRAERVVNALVARRMQGDPLMSWAVPHGMAVMGASSPYEFFRKLRLYDTRSFSHRIQQDFLLLAGAEDHYVPLRQFHRQARRLANVRSFTGRIFTRAEHAQSHCQVGNVGLALRTIIAWIEERVASEVEPGRRPQSAER